MASNDSSPKALPGYSSKGEKATKIDTDKAVALEGEDAERLSITGSSHIDDTHRMLKSRHIQLIGIGGTIGTVLFVQIGQGLIKGGPGSLFIAFSYWCTVVLAVTMCMAEMVTYLPISSPFVRFAGRYVDEALGFAAGWNFFIFEAALVPFEVTACNIILQFWTDKIPTAVVIVVIILLYALINVLAVRYFGEVEFWAAIGKVILIVGLIFFTFIAMLGGNPKHERFGFTYWQDPGAFKEAEIGPNKYTGALGKWLGFLQCLVLAAFTIAGPDYVSMAAGETANPRKVLPRAFNAVFYRLTAFFVLGSLCVGILVPYNSEDLIDAYTNGAKGAAASPYVVAMKRLGISGLPHVVNAAVLTAAFSAGNSYLYCASRSLYGLALEGKAPRILTKCTKSGIPIYCTAVVLCFALLAFLQLGKSSSIVLNWFVSLVTASQLLNFATICLSYICFHKALKAQGISRDSLPYKAWFMPYGAYYALAWTFVMAFVGGWTVFLPGMWDVPTFLFSYMMIFVFPALYIGYKIVMRTKIHKSAEIDLVKNLDEIEEHERSYMPEKNLSIFERILDKLFG